MTENVYFMCHHKIRSKTVGIRTKIALRHGLEDKLRLTGLALPKDNYVSVQDNPALFPLLNITSYMFP